MTDTAYIPLLMARGEFVNAKRACEGAIRHAATPELYCTLAQIEMRLGDRARAQYAIGKALELDPNDAATLNHQGSLLAAAGRTDDALAAFDRACRVRPAYAPALVNRGSLLLDLNRPADALASLDAAAKAEPRDAEIAFLRGRAFHTLGRSGEASTAFAQAVAFDPHHTGALNAQADALRREGRNDEALAAFDAVLAIDPANPLALQNSATLLHKMRRFADAIERYERLIAVLRVQPTSPAAIDYALAMNISCRREICAWNGLAAREAALIDRVRKGRTTFNPFLSLMISDDPQVHALCAERSWKQFGRVTDRVSSRPRQDGRIRIGYLSSDFRDHPTGWLIAALIERHDRSRYEIFGYSTGPDDGSTPRARLAAAFDRFVDLSSATDGDAARRVAADGIDILVDLNGLTEGKRPGVLNARPAPVIAHYLGYPGPMPSAPYDYFIADPFVLPADDDRFYGCAIARVPGTYQANSYASDPSVPPATREQAGLSQDAFVFCGFSQAVKLSPAVFDVWMRILARAPGGILWLLDCGATVSANLRKEAARRGVDPVRLVFAPRAGHAAHMARLSLADVVLDTWPCGAHTTASDALWAGVPTITCPGRGFASRVAGSLLTAAGLQDLIVSDLKTYEDVAVAFANEPARLAQMKERVAVAKRSRLFDTAAMCRELEAAYATMNERRLAGAQPASFAV